jgi:hypothetical protein
MNVNTVYQVNPEAECDLCGYKWVAVIETDEIDFGSSKEVKIIDKLECPNCGNMTILKPNQND